VGNMISRRFRFGASFIDSASGVRFEGHHPHERPDLWKLYLHEAEGRYRNFGFEGKLHLQELDEGTGVSLFFLGFDTRGNPVAGVRCHGPLESSNQAFVLQEMGASPEIGMLARTIDDEVPLGVVEIKGAWSKGEAATGHRLIEAIARCATHSMSWLGAEHAIAAISDTLLFAGTASGGRMLGEAAVPFPDDRYRTVALWWHRSRSLELATPEGRRSLRLESEQLSRGPGFLHAGPVSPDSARTRAWRPLILDVRARDQREVLRVLREDPSLQVIDRLAEQRAQLTEIKPAPGKSLEEEAQRWIYYPWRRALVRLLGPRSFNTLRLDRNRNKLTRAEQSQQRRLRIGVVGLSAGHTIAHVLAMEGLAGELRVADFDTLEVSNLNRIPGSVLDLGVNKAVVAARRIGEIDPYLRVLTVTEGITPENLGCFLDGLDLVIEECDSLDVKMLVREAARERRIPVLMETSDRGVLDVERFDLEPDRPLFHGLLPGLHSSDLAGLSIQQKAPFVLRILGAADITSRGAASLLEVGQTVTGWPQLGSEVTLGAATAAAAVRRFGLAGDLPSGRVRFDVEEILSGIGPVLVDGAEEAEAEYDYEYEHGYGPGHEVEGAYSTPSVGATGAAAALTPAGAADPIEIIVDAARWAPSGGNIQPWRFEADANQIRMYLVPERTTTMDVRHRGSYVAIGAALFNARVAAASLKNLGECQLFPEGSPSHHVATLMVGESTDYEIAPLEPRMRARVTNRQMGDTGPIDSEVVKLLAQGVERETARLRLAVSRDRIEKMAELLAESDRIRFLLPTLHQEMVGELRIPGQHSLDEGLDVRTLELSPPEMAVLELLRRPDVMEHLGEWRAGQGLGARTRAMVGSSSALAVVTVPRSDPAWYVRGGAAVERLWLTAELHGLAVQPVSPVFLYAVDEKDFMCLGGERHVDTLFDLSQRFNEFWDLDDGENAALLLRLSHAPPPSTRSARLPLSELLSREFEMA
jgi:molybdopterin/thiamine biosynthesis adenylyltransferase